MSTEPAGEAVPQGRPASHPVHERGGPVAGQTGALLGYARVSTTDQREALQLDALHAAGCVKVFVDRGVSGSTPLDGREGWRAAAAYARPGDTLLVWRLDRITRRGLRHLLDTVAMLREQGISVRSLTEPVDTSGPAGEVILAIVGWLSEQERETLRQRTLAGMAAARARGARIGRPPVDPERVAAARALIAAGHSVSRAAATVGLGRSTLYRELRASVNVDS